MDSSQTIPPRRRRLMPALAAITASLALAACGSSAASSSNSSAKSASASTRSSSAQRTSFMQCLKNHGVTLPARSANGGTFTRPAGAPPTGASGRFGAANPTRLSAFKACGAPGQRPVTGSGTTATG